MKRFVYAASITLASVAAPLAVMAAPLSAPSAAAVVLQAHYSSARTPLGTLLADSAARALIGRYFPDLLTSRMVTGGAANRFTLRSLQRFRPTEFTDARLTSIDADFARLPSH